MPRQPKQPKDTNAPKRSQSSYFIFSNKRRPILKELHKEKKITEIAKLIGEEWKNLSEEDKKPYQEQAEIEKQQYQEKLTAYKETDQYREFQAKLKRWKEEHQNNGNSSISRSRGGNKQTKMKKPQKPKKPSSYPKGVMTSYLLYSNERRPLLQNEYKDKKITEISKLIGAEWKNLTDEQKIPYSERQKQSKIRYDNEMSPYKETEEYKNYTLVLKDYNIRMKEYKKYIANPQQYYNNNNNRESSSDDSSDSGSDSSSDSSDDSSDSSSDDSSD